MNSDILWLITARSGSKSIPNKNIRLLGQFPLMVYRIKTALKISFKSAVWLSTDSRKYAEIGSSFGAQTPFLRPAYLSEDNSPSADVVLHAMEIAEQQGSKKKYIGLLEPTSPFVYSDLLESAIQLLDATPRAQAIVSVKETRPNTVFIQEESQYLTKLASTLAGLSATGRQHFSRQVTPSGGFYISNWEAFKKNKTFYVPETLSFLVPPECELEIDEPIDWQFAEFLVQKEIVNLTRLI